MMIIGQVLGTLVYNIPLPFPWYYQLVPTLSFVRGCQYMTDHCLTASCYNYFSEITVPEANASIAMLYIHAIVYMAATLYFS